MDAESVLEVCVGAAREAGAIIRAQSGRIAVQATKATSADLVTEADKACQDLIEARIRARFPGAAFLGEESVAAGSTASAAALEAALEPSHDLLFIIDPIDGTTNFVCGIPFSCVSIGVARRNELLVACIYEPYRDELFSAVRGRGAFLRAGAAEPLRLAVSPEPDLRKCVLGYGLGSSSRVAAVMLRGIGQLEPLTRGQRSLGSAALQLAYVAAGRLGAFYEVDLSSWDLSAGALLVAEAGGRVTDTRGDPFSLRVRDVLASNGAAEAHAGIVSALAAAGADRAPAYTPAST